MTVHFIGAGPGAPDLLTLRGRDLIAASPVCIYAGSLVPSEMLAFCPPGARLVDSALMTLDEIVDEMVRAHTHGLDVARLASGDPSVFSAMAEQMRRLDALDIPYDVCPGVPAYAAAAAALRRELTVPTVAQTVTLTRIAARATPMPEGEGIAELTRAAGTVVAHLAVHRIEEVVKELLDVHGPDCPAAVVAHASRDHQIVLRGRLDGIAAAVREARIERTAVVIVGPALAAEQFPDSHLYSDGRCRS
ncbi:MAG: precorrin-4 C(11)-methyltransferase [Pseudonocardia sp.]|uniref:precorrin-4 C(11)-methyltransferase n=1 Tax=unclassified Pseudonocardia TaxID=2619320 RepID=UPI00086ED269|nr:MULTISPECIES: precorrin-4 C(11)-methyltransferase [unclassified Pseudonocardia]MBN9107974.1 precorrin-4 C(11)-methyltransferase [Pseudonocardia sp.]ODU17161.1 MAG: precorrin-4 C(11)-methyltransferase [Pseudonocardia sp. SCN 72-51]ODU99940.1 MAG: precorrin-4 C(11)-methyltransferase [Pseudonocardia sp. SCN 73-27]